MHLRYASDSGAVRICQWGGGAKRGSEATGWVEGVGGWGFPPPTVGKLLKISV